MNVFEKKQKNLDLTDYQYTKTIVCPFCGFNFSESSEYELDEDGSEIECEECGEIFYCLAHFSIRYISKKPDDFK